MANPQHARRLAERLPWELLEAGLHRDALRRLGLANSAALEDRVGLGLGLARARAVERVQGRLLQPRRRGGRARVLRAREDRP